MTKTVTPDYVSLYRQSQPTLAYITEGKTEG
jgi:hypothetical protein